MKKIFLSLSILVLGVVGCEKQVTNSGITISQQRIMEIANKYNLEVSNAIKVDTILRSEQELLLFLNLLNSSSNEKSIQFGDSTTIDKITFDQLKNKLKNSSISLNSNSVSLFKNTSSENSPPGNKYSRTVYFNNTFPALNYYVTLNHYRNIFACESNINSK